jgi:hypothetical protein
MAVLGRGPDPLAHEPRRSSWTPDAIRALLGAQDFRVVADDDLLTLAGRLPLAVRRPRSLRAGRVAVADADR